MDSKERIDALVKTLDETVEHLIYEYDISVFEMAGVLEVLKFRLLSDAREDCEDGCDCCEEEDE